MDAFDRIDAALSADPAARAAWDNVDLLGMFMDLDGNGELENKHALEVMVKLMPILAYEAAQALLDKLCDLYALSMIEKVKAWYIEHRYLSTERAKAVTRGIRS